MMDVTICSFPHAQQKSYSYRSHMRKTSSCLQHRRSGGFGVGGTCLPRNWKGSTAPPLLHIWRHEVIVFHSFCLLN